MDDAGHAKQVMRLQVRIEVYEELHAEIAPWMMEERDEAGREALSNVLQHLDAELVEHRQRLAALGAAEGGR